MPGDGEVKYGVFHGDDESQTGSHSRPASSAGTCCDDAPSDGFEASGRDGELVFGDGIY